MWPAVDIILLSVNRIIYSTHQTSIGIVLTGVIILSIFFGVRTIVLVRGEIILTRINIISQNVNKMLNMSI